MATDSTSMMAGPQTPATTRPVEEVLDTIGDPIAREILIEICRRPQSAGAIAERLEYSRETIYRRVNTLKAYDLVLTEVKLMPDGHHHQRFKSAFDGVLISVDDGEYDVQLCRRESLPDRFAELWADLRPR